ncbi:hypothetical protein E2C01_086461 [Portunus trituberculatus]|uniref:Uncharacterized protein n=1 Tax=Portunus trituberculatus TaxID=210409 RepID=A0A5B7J9R5_PORTR|nr:hypothetical protein [Portunus trituberculatus]
MGRVCYLLGRAGEAAVSAGAAAEAADCSYSPGRSRGGARDCCTLMRGQGPVQEGCYSLARRGARECGMPRHAARGCCNSGLAVARGYCTLRSGARGCGTQCVQGCCSLDRGAQDCCSPCRGARGCYSLTHVVPGYYSLSRVVLGCCSRSRAVLGCCSLNLGVAGWCSLGCAAPRSCGPSRAARGY